MRRREQQRRRSVRPKDHDLFAADRVDHRDHVVDQRLNETPFGLVDRIRRARSPRVEPHVAAERRQTIEKPHKRRLIPHEVNREHARLDDEHIERSRPDHLIGDPARIGLHIPGLDLVHGRSLAPQPNADVKAIAARQSRHRGSA